MLAVARRVEGRDTRSVLVPFVSPEALVIARVVFPVHVHEVEQLLRRVLGEDLADIGVLARRVAELVERPVTVVGLYERRDISPNERGNALHATHPEAVERPRVVRTGFVASQGESAQSPKAWKSVERLTRRVRVPELGREEVSSGHIGAAGLSRGWRNRTGKDGWSAPRVCETKARRGRERTSRPGNDGALPFTQLAGAKAGDGQELRPRNLWACASAALRSPARPGKAERVESAEAAPASATVAAARKAG